MSKHDHSHKLPLWTLFLALLALTAGEVGLYEIWRHTQFVPKIAIVLIILVLTLPKAAIVMIYFMHLKFEKQIIAVLAVVPLFMAVGAVLAILSDIVTLKHRDQTHNFVEQIGVYEGASHGLESGHDGYGDSEAGEMVEQHH